MPLSPDPVREVKASLFRVLGHPARVRILELLREGERSVGALQAELGLDSGGTSQHLAALRRIGLVESRREGTSVYYRVDDHRVFELLEAGRALITRQLAEQQSILRELADDVIARVFVAALVAIALGGALASRLGATFPVGSDRAGGGARSLVAVAGFWALAAGDALGAPLHERARAARSASTV